MTRLEYLLFVYSAVATVCWYFSIESLVHARSQWKHWECIAREFKDYIIHKED